MARLMLVTALCSARNSEMQGLGPLQTDDATDGVPDNDLGGQVL